MEDCICLQCLAAPYLPLTENVKCAEKACMWVKKWHNTVNIELWVLLSFERNERTVCSFHAVCHPQKANQFDPDVVLNQLRYSGMLETVKIRRAGFPVRRTFKDFYSRSAEIPYKCCKCQGWTVVDNGEKNRPVTLKPLKSWNPIRAIMSSAVLFPQIQGDPGGQNPLRWWEAELFRPSHTSWQREERVATGKDQGGAHMHKLVFVT